MTIKKPPKYVNVPTSVIYSALPSPIRETLIQIIGLAWESKFRETPPLTFEELAKILGKSDSTVYQHVQYLRSHSWLQFRSAGGPAYTFSLIDRSAISENQGSTASFSENSESFVNFLPKDKNQLNQEKENNNVPRNRKIPVPPSNTDEKVRSTDLSHPAVIAYRTLMHSTPNIVQRTSIISTVQDLDLWCSTLEHWLEHNWRPTNVPGLLNSYRSGGRRACLNCNAGSGRQNGMQGKATLTDIDDIFTRMKNGDNH